MAQKLPSPSLLGDRSQRSDPDPNFTPLGNTRPPYVDQLDLDLINEPYVHEPEDDGQAGTSYVTPIHPVAPGTRSPPVPNTAAGPLGAGSLLATISSFGSRNYRLARGVDPLEQHYQQQAQAMPDVQAEQRDTVSDLPANGLSNTRVNIGGGVRGGSRAIHTGASNIGGGASPPDDGNLFGAATNRNGFKAAIHSTTHRIGRHFGFQAFNVIPDTKEQNNETWTPATIHLVTDHLENLLVGNLFRRDTRPGTEEDRFARCVNELHMNIMGGYQDWCEHVGLPMRVPEVQFKALSLQGVGTEYWEWQLEELALYFLLYSEAANLRHLPECLWFFMWCMRNSINKSKQACCPPEQYSARRIVRHAKAHPQSVIDTAARRVELRNQCLEEVRLLREACQVPAEGADHTERQLGELLAKARAEVAASPDLRHKTNDDDKTLLVDMIVFGDCGCFLDKLVQPLFECLAQSGKHGEQGVEIACRLGYDDFNESFASRKNVYRALSALGVEVDSHAVPIRIIQTDYIKERGPLGALLDLGLPAGPVPISQPRQQRYIGMLQRQTVEVPEQILSRSPRDWQTRLGRDWWLMNVLGKTFIECRSYLMIYRAFFRVVAFHILWFQLLASLSWSNLNWFVASLVLLTHAMLSLLEQLAYAYTQRSPGQVKLLGHRRLSQVTGILLWAAINGGMWFCLVWILTNKTRVVWWIGAAAYTGTILLHGLLSSRCGYVVSSWHEIADSCNNFSRRRCIPGFLFRGIGYVFRLLGAASSHPSARDYVAPLRMKVPFWQGICNTLFWIAVLALKFVFDWFLLIQPLEGPIKGLWRRRWLSSGPGANQAADADIVLVLARALPAFLLTLVDTGIFYSVVSAIVGVLKGLVWLNLGIMYSFSDMRTNFHQAAGLFWTHVISERGALNITRSINQPLPGHLSTPPSMSRQQEKLRMSMNSIPESLTQAGAIPLTSHQAQQDEAGRQQADLAGSGQTKSNALGDESNAEWLVFADIWNCIVNELYELDLLSHREQTNLLFVRLEVDDSMNAVEGMRRYMLPVFFNAGHINNAAEQSDINAGAIKALVELRALVVWMLRELSVITPTQANTFMAFTPLRSINSQARIRARSAGLQSLIKLLKSLQGLGKSRPNERVAAISSLRGQILAVLDAVQAEADQTQKYWGSRKAESKAAQEVLLVIQNLKEGMLAPDTWRERTRGAGDGYGGPFHLLYPEDPAEETNKKSVIKKALDQLVRMLSESAGSTAPRSKEAIRILAFFLSSLNNPQLKRPPPLHHMLSLNTLTPHYAEDVLYSLAKKDTARSLGMSEDKTEGMNDLLTETQDGVSPMTYIRSLYPKDWNNFLDRMARKKANNLRGIDPAAVSEEDFCEQGALSHLAFELQTWAAYRGQQLARTVRGMMAYETALLQMARWETPKPSNMPEEHYKLWLGDVIASKYTYVVASQIYGANRKSPQVGSRWIARGVEKLLHSFLSLRVAYVDTGPKGGGPATQWSVLIRNNGDIPEGQNSCVDEVYRVRLPTNPSSGKGVIIGEGKPENQNAAIIFCFNEVVQAIDMNQDNYLAEAFKIRNLIAEFTPAKTLKQKRKALRKSAADMVNGTTAGPQPQLEGAPRKRGPQPIACVGMREWIFTETSGALASFAAATEFTFGTIVQRVMSWPGGVRFHYGHPDLWNKLFIMTRGGVSKPTKSFHISEDVFAGYNHTLRGASIKFLEFIQVGKGRDMGMDSVLGFERKVASGNGEQALSRDAYRLGTQFSFPRLLAWYHTGIGFFVNTYLIFFTVSASIWVYLLLALSDSQNYPCGPKPINATRNATNATCSTITGQATGMAAGSVVQIGALTIATYAVELLLERGFVIAMGSLLYQFLQGSILFGIFRSRTSGFSFKDDIQNGGAAYVATGRGYALVHLPFTLVYTSYARSHLYYSVHLIVLLILLAVVGPQEYFSSTWGAWLVAVCLLFAPFWFNPQTFSMTQTKNDFNAWRLWMSDVYDGPSKSTWFTWNEKQLAPLRNEGHPEVGNPAQHPWINAILGFGTSLPTALLVLGCISRLKNTKINRYLLFGIVTGAIWGFVLVVVVTRDIMRNRLKRIGPQWWRITRMVLIALAAIAIVIFAFVIIPKIGSSTSGLRNLVIILFANFEIGVIFGQALLFFGAWSQAARRHVDRSYRLLDYIIGYFLFMFLFLLSFLGFVGRIQSALLYNVKFTKSLQRGRLLGPYVQVVVERCHRERAIREKKEAAQLTRQDRQRRTAEVGELTRSKQG